MSIPLPSPKLFPKKNVSSEQSSEKKASSEQPDVKKPFVRKPHLTQRLSGNEDLKAISDALHKQEDANRKAGRYDRNRNGKQRKQR